MKLLTLGHSNVTLETFEALLRPSRGLLLVDVRRYPKSRYPQFNQNALRDFIESRGAEYLWVPQLGGYRQGINPQDYPNVPKALRGFAEYMEGKPFRVAVQSVLAKGKSFERVALLCSEGDPAHCHRSLIADYLIKQGHPVKHLLYKETANG
jgi:uncharacterized protein (DUF488 family)